MNHMNHIMVEEEEEEEEEENGDEEEEEAVIVSFIHPININHMKKPIPHGVGDHIKVKYHFITYQLFSKMNLFNRSFSSK